MKFLNEEFEKIWWQVWFNARLVMDDKTYIGSLAEAKVVAELTYQKWFVFSQVSGKAPFDLVAAKNGLLKRVNVKGCSIRNRNGVYPIQIGSIRSNKKENVIHKFNPASSDVLACYILEADKVCFIKSSTITRGRQIVIKSKPFLGKCDFILDDLLTMEG